MSSYINPSSVIVRNYRVSFFYFTRSDPSHKIFLCLSLCAASLIAALVYMHLTSAMTLSKKTFVIAGLPVHVYSERHLTEHNGPVVVMFFLHGRTGTAKGIEWIVEDTLKHVAQKRRRDNSAMDLVVVTFVNLIALSCLVPGEEPTNLSLGPTQPRR
jgi:hypothetical protein